MNEKVKEEEAAAEEEDLEKLAVEELLRESAKGKTLSETCGPSEAYITSTRRSKVNKRFLNRVVGGAIWSNELPRKTKRVKKNLRSIVTTIIMEGLVHDLNSALEESTASSSHKRKSWKRRKKKNENSSDSSSSLSSSSESRIPQVLRNRTRKQKLEQESDSFNESKHHHPRPKRKRKCKRYVGSATEGKQSQKRKKIRTISSEMKCIRPGKRPRSASSPMDLDEDESSSSYDDEDDEEEDEEDFVVDDEDDRGQEADDEQSDWPGINEDLDEEPIGIRRIPSKIDNRRSIRAGTRKNVHVLKNHDCLLSSNDQLNKFLQDSSRIELKWGVRDFRDRNKLVQFANLYSLNLKFEDPFTLRLTKTCNTVQLNNKDGLFLIPGAPSSSIDFKRRRKTPPIFETTLDEVRSPQRDSQSPASKRRTNYYDGSRSS